MPRIDKFFQALFQHKAREIEVVAGKHAMLHVDDAEPRVITAQPLTQAQLELLLAEISTVQAMDKLTSGGELALEYTSPAGKAPLRARSANGVLRLSIGRAAARQITPRVTTATPPSAPDASAAPLRPPAGVEDRPRSK